MRQFGPFLLLEKLGAGGMGEVWLARVRADGVESDCVVKMIKPELREDLESARRFVDEARVATLLQHPNIAGIFDVGRVDDTLYYAMEHVPGLDAHALYRDARARGAPIPQTIVASILDDALAGLEAAHQSTHPVTGHALGVVHRDVSPHNLIVGFDGRTRLIDFGLALSTLKREKTAADVVHGKLAYLPPEHARGETVDRRADLFAAGIVLYELLSGRRFYGPLRPKEIMGIVRSGKHRPDDLAELGPFDPLLRKAWAPRHERFASAHQMREALVEIMRPAPKGEVAAWVNERFAAEAGAAGERSLRHKHAVAPDEATLKNRFSLLTDSVPVVESDRVYVAPGVHGAAHFPAPGVVHIILRGHGDAEAAAWQCGVVDEALTRHDEVRFFSDIEQLTTHDAGMRQTMIAWQSRVKGRVSQLILFRSRLVVFAISVANRLSGGGAEVTSSRSRFEQELGRATAAAGAG